MKESKEEPINCKKCGLPIDRKDLVLVEEEPWHVDCAYKDYTEFLRRAELNDSAFESTVKEIQDVESLRAEAFKRYQEIAAQRNYREKINKTEDDENEKLKKIVSLNEKVRRLEAELKAVLKDILVREQKEDLNEVLEKCWCCVKIEGHGGFMHCKNTRCKLYPKLSEFSVIAYGETQEHYTSQEIVLRKEMEKEREINFAMYR